MDCGMNTFAFNEVNAKMQTSLLARRWVQKQIQLNQKLPVRGSSLPTMPPAQTTTSTLLVLPNYPLLLLSPFAQYP